MGYDVSERAELYEETVDNLIFDLMARVSRTERKRDWLLRGITI